MFGENSFIDERILLIVIAVGTLLVYLFVPIPNVLYKEEKTSSDIINFGENTGCYDVKTTEVECPHGPDEQGESHSFNMKDSIHMEENNKNINQSNNNENIVPNIKMNITDN